MQLWQWWQLAFLEPGIYFAINSPAGVVGTEANEIISKINSWGYSVTVEQMNQLAKDVGESTLFARTGGAPSLASRNGDYFC